MRGPEGFAAGIMGRWGQSTAPAILHDDFGLNRLRAHFHGGLVEIGLEVEQRKARVAGKAAAIIPVRLAVDIGIVAIATA
jgi:hypothetical protein